MDYLIDNDNQDSQEWDSRDRWRRRRGRSVSIRVDDFRRVAMNCRTSQDSTLVDTRSRLKSECTSHGPKPSHHFQMHLRSAKSVSQPPLIPFSFKHILFISVSMTFVAISHNGVAVVSGGIAHVPVVPVVPVLKPQSSYYYSDYTVPVGPKARKWIPPPQKCPETGRTVCSKVSPMYPTEEVYDIVIQTKAKRFNFTNEFVNDADNDNEPNFKEQEAEKPAAKGYIVYQSAVHYGPAGPAVAHVTSHIPVAPVAVYKKLQHNGGYQNRNRNQNQIPNNDDYGSNENENRYNQNQGNGYSIGSEEGGNREAGNQYSRSGPPPPREPIQYSQPDPSSYENQIGNYNAVNNGGFNRGTGQPFSRQYRTQTVGADYAGGNRDAEENVYRDRRQNSGNEYSRNVPQAYSAAQQPQNGGRKGYENVNQNDGNGNGNSHSFRSPFRNYQSLLERFKSQNAPNADQYESQSPGSSTTGNQQQPYGPLTPRQYVPPQGGIGTTSAAVYEGPVSALTDHGPATGREYYGSSESYYGSDTGPQYGNAAAGGAPPSGRYKRQADSDSGSGDLCETKSMFITPRAALNDRSEWRFVVNVPERDQRFRQVIRVELCSNPGGSCSNEVSSGLPFGQTSRCRQKYIKKKLLALEQDGGSTSNENFFIPSCCVCEIVRSKRR